MESPEAKLAYKNIKFLYKGELVRNMMPLKYDVIASWIESNFKLKDQSYILSYYDSDNDCITLTSDEDIEEAADYFGDKQMTLYIKIINTNSKSILGTSIINRTDLMQSVAGRDEMSELISEINKSSNKNQPIVQNERKISACSDNQEIEVDDGQSFELLDPSLGKSQSLHVKKVISNRSVNESDSVSVLNNDQYKQEAQEIDDMINEMSTIVQDLLKNGNAMKRNMRDQKVLDEMLNEMKKYNPQDKSDLKSSSILEDSAEVIDEESLKINDLNQDQEVVEEFKLQAEPFEPPKELEKPVEPPKELEKPVEPPKEVEKPADIVIESEKVREPIVEMQPEQVPIEESHVVIKLEEAKALPAAIEEPSHFSNEIQVPKLNAEELREMGVKAAKKHGVEYLKKHIEIIFKDIVHKGITCSV